MRQRWMDEASSARPDPPYALPTFPRVFMSAPHFAPATYAAQLAEKAARLVDLLAPFDAPAPEVFDSPREHYRLRTQSLLSREEGHRHYAMFAQGDKHKANRTDRTKKQREGKK